MAGNHVYHAVKDKTGFLWFATETGVSRFDGTNFKNFTTKDGLPDNEILKLFSDSKGRVWMMPFKSSICYYYKGKIYNEKNDALIRSIKIGEYIENIFEDKQGNIILAEFRKVTIVYASGAVVSIKNIADSSKAMAFGGFNNRNNLIIHVDHGHYELIPVKQNKHEFRKIDLGFDFWATQSAPFYNNDHLIIYPDNFKNVFYKNNLIIKNLATSAIDSVVIKETYNNISYINDSLIFFDTPTGSILYSFSERKVKGRFLENEEVSSTLADNESNIWFTTLTRGIYRLSSEANRNIYVADPAGKKDAVTALATTGKEIIIGTNSSRLFAVDKFSGTIRSRIIGSSLFKNPVIAIKAFRGNLYVLSLGILRKADPQLNTIKEFLQTDLGLSYKDFDIDSAGIMYLASHYFMPTFSEERDKTEYGIEPDMGPVMTKRLEYVKPFTPYNDRTTAVCATDSGIYIGTLTGLKFIGRNNEIRNIGETNAALSKRITRLAKSGKYLWVGTNDEGVFCFDGKNVVNHLSEKTGLTSNLIRCLYTDKNFLWVGTDRGLNKAAITDAAGTVLQTYTISDGLTSDMINAVYTEHDTVYVGTTEGLSFFSEHKLKNNSVCDLQVLDITVSGKSVPYDSTNIVISHKDNNIRFDFVALSFKSEGQIVYYYQLSGIDKEWKQTKENFLQYPTLPSGSYSLSLYAVNKFGVKSKAVNINFEIEKKLIEESWFIFLIAGIVGIIAWLIAAWQVRRVKNAQKIKLANSNKIAELEQQALKAQMNPHFIFNCLNSIQQYVIDKDVQGANTFISGFARLIRQTLDNSGKQTITVAEEERFLKSYLDLEKSRFEEKFNYAIWISSQIRKDEISLPPMLLQPYIENCIRHGILHKEEGKGFIDIRFDLEDNMLVCEVTDNGVGREAAAMYKSKMHIHYQSKGTELTAQRINMINKNSKRAIILKVEDLANEQGQALGTKVTMLIPVEKFIEQK
ncbi:MAG: histidine kinase [Bacteroidetes bacterium]|nr:histidine kinase [Bacteroidota bacterium]